MWRIVIQGELATLAEIEQYWCLMDIVQANQIMAVQSAADAARERAIEAG